MLEKIVQVIFRGKNDIGGPAKQAADDVEGFSQKAGSLLKGLGAAAAALGLASFFKTAVEEAQKSREAMDALANVVDNSGASFRAMAPEIDATLSRLARMTKFGDDEFAGVLRDMTLRTGDASWSLKNLGLAADLAAAAQIPLEDAAKTLANAHEGNTKALFKLVPELKGAANWQELLAQKTAGAAEAQMLALGPIEAAKKQFGEFAESVGKAILGNEAFSASGFGFADTLANMASWVDENSAAIGEFIDALVLTGRNILEGFTPAFTVLKQVAGPVLSLLVFAITEMSFAFRAGTVVVEEFAGAAYQTIGKLVQKVGSVLKLLGVEVVSAIGGELRDFGDKLDREASARWDKLVVDQKAFIEKLKTGGDKGVADVKTQEKAKTRIVREELDEQETKQLTHAQAVKKTHEMLSASVVAYRDVIKTLAPAAKEALTETPAVNFDKALKGAKETADALIAKMKQEPLTPEILEAEASAEMLGDALSGAASNAMAVGEQFGGMNDEAKTVLSTVQSVGSTLANLAKNGLSFAGVAGVLGGVATIVSTMMAGDRERRDLLRKNNEQLEKLRTDGVSLSTKVSGEKIAGVTGALGGLNIAALAGLEAMPGDKGQKKAMGILLEQLAKSGLGLSDLDAVASELGISIRRSNGAIDFAQLGPLLQGLQENLGSLTRVGQSFGDQLQFFKDSQRLGGTTGGADTFASLGSFVRNTGNVSALANIDFSDPTKARDALLGLFNQLNNGTLDAASLGRLTGTQFRGILDELITMANDLIAAPAGTSAGGIATGDVAAPEGLASVPAPEAGGIGTGTGPTVEATMLEHAETVIDLLTTHTGLLERTAVAGEGSFATLLELRDVALKLAAAGAGGGMNDGLGTALTLERRLAGNPSL